LIVRFNASAKDWTGHKELQVKLGFAIPLNNPHPGGLPDPEENQQLNDIEDIVRREVQAKTIGIHVLVLTTGTMREFVFYVAAGADIAAIHQAAQHAVGTHEVQCQAIMDPDWDAYNCFGRVAT
jgi:hypothetical protein